MASDSAIDPLLRAELEAVYAFYARLSAGAHPESGLGGKLLYAGQLDTDGCRLVRAANIAGAASLSGAPDSNMQRYAIREGVIDFLVTSLDEALRILKNEIRKRNAVSVGVSMPAPALIGEMRERGVLPDLLRNSEADEFADFVSHGSQVLPAAAEAACQSLRVWQPASADLEQRAMQLIPESDCAARRWLRLSHRYLGPQARRIRSAPISPYLARELGPL